MVETEFEQLYGITAKLAALRAAMVVAIYGLPVDFRKDLEQEALLEVWRKRRFYDPNRGSWRAFADRVMANRLSSVMRQPQQSMHVLEEQYIEEAPSLTGRADWIELKLDVRRTLGDVSTFDRVVAIFLLDHSVSEISRRLCISRATAYRSIHRLRRAFASAGLHRYAGVKHSTKFARQSRQNRANLRT